MSLETNEHLEYTEYEPDMPIPEIEYQNETSENYNDNYEMSNEILVKQEQNEYDENLQNETEYDENDEEYFDEECEYTNSTGKISNFQKAFFS